MPVDPPIELFANFRGGRRDSRVGSGWVLKGKWKGRADCEGIAHASLYIEDKLVCGIVCGRRCVLHVFEVSTLTAVHKYAYDLLRSPAARDLAVKL